MAKEHPDLEEAKNKLIISHAKMKQALKETEDEIVSCLNSGKGNPIDSEDQISVLEELKIKAGAMKVRQLKRRFSNINCTEVQKCWFSFAIITFKTLKGI